MEKRNTFTKILAVVGTVLIWFPILAPILLSLIWLIIERSFHFDYLMPAELFPVALVGGGLLLWAALRAKARRGLIGGGLAAAAVMLGGAQTVAVLTGLASGEIEPNGGWYVLALASIILYSLALVVVGVGGILLLRDLFLSSRTLAESHSN